MSSSAIPPHDESSNAPKATAIVGDNSDTENDTDRVVSSRPNQDLCESGNEGEMDDVTLDGSGTTSMDQNHPEMNDLSDSLSTRGSAMEQSSEMPQQDDDGCATPIATLTSPPKKDTPKEELSEDEKKEESQSIDGNDELSSKLHSTTVIHSSEETSAETFSRLSEGLKLGALSHKDVVDSMFNVLVGGAFDLESRFIIEDSQNIVRMVYLLDIAPPRLQAEMWSVFVGVVRKSNRNLEACSRVGLISMVLDRLEESDAIVSDLLVQLLGVLTSYSISVKETKRFLRALKAENGRWRKNSAKLLQVLKEMPKRDGADVFFSFPGSRGAGIALPPLTKWPYQNGWTFSTWLRMDPLNSVNFEKERPYLYCFRTNKGIGYSCYFMGNCLVVSSVRAPGKEVARCIRHELAPRKWHHIAISHVYSRWSKSEIQCFVDGQLIEAFDVTWLASTTDQFDRCSIGCGPDGEEPFCGQIAALYVFAEAITLQQANSLYCLGATYQSSFRHDAESDLPDGYKKHLFDGRLSSSLVISYCPKNCDGQLCLHSSPKTSASYFVQVPHAIMKEGVEVVTTHSIHNSLHSVGGIQMLLPLFAQLDLPHVDAHDAPDYDICSTLLSAISLLLSTSSSAQQQLFHSKGFLIISSVLHEASPRHLKESVLDALFGMAKFLLTCPAGISLLKQLFDHLLFNPQLWIKAPATLQIRLYQYLASDFLSNSSFVAVVRRCATIVELLHAIKFYYWVVPPRAPSTYTVKEVENRPSRGDIVKVRSHILALLSRLILMPDSKESGDVLRDLEFNALLNFVATIHEDDNLYDVLALTTRLLAERPAAMVPAFDRKKGLAVVFKLLNSSNELIRVPALKIFGYFLCRSTLKRKNDSVGNQNLLTLLTDRLLLNASYLSLATYNVLFEILIEQMSPLISYTVHAPISDAMRFENPTMLKVIANLITQSENRPELIKVKRLFLEDLLQMCEHSRDNRRTILQMSVWQEWLISLAYVFPANTDEAAISELVFRVFAQLLFHAIRLEYGGWRVWVDTLAIAHSKVSWERYRASSRVHVSAEQRQRDVIADTLSDIVSSVVRVVDGKTDECERKGTSPEEQPTAIYRTPEFRWSNIHLRLLNDLLSAIENVIDEWKGGNVSVLDAVNSSENGVFVANCVHILSQLADSLIMACGGLLPLLAAATSPNSELEIVDSTGQGLAIGDAARLLARFALLADVFVFVSGISFSDLEQEKNMPSGGILRQTLRLVSTMAVRNILACRAQRGDVHVDALRDMKQIERTNTIAQFISGALDTGDNAAAIDTERLLQEVDLQRLKGIVYRDMEENRQAQFLALAVTYLLSVLMVSRYRDILEPPSTPSPFFDTTKAGVTARNTEGDVSGEHVNGISSNADKVQGETSRRERRDSGVDAEGTIAENVASIRLRQMTVNKDDHQYSQDHLDTFNDRCLESRALETGERRAYLTTKLQKALETTAPLLREIMSDFRSFLQKTLLGTHGQEIMNDVKVMETMKNQAGSVIELVMLLCSQEWQTSLQKHAGLAFIELVNEGRLMAHATRDHVLRVANEADFILNRLRAEDVSKHAQFEGDAAEQMHHRRKEETINEHLIMASRRRDLLVASRLLDKLTTILISPSGAWANSKPDLEVFWKLDVWEDDSRRRKRFVPNPYGCRHSAARLRTVVESGASAQEAEKAREELLRELVARRVLSLGSLKTGSALGELVDESDIDKWASEPEPNVDLQRENTSYSTPGRLIAPGIVVPGTLSITSSELYFDADEEHPLYKQQDPKSLRYCDNLHGRWHFHEIRAIFLRRYLLENTALELFLASRTAVMFAFADEDTVRKVVECLPRVGVGVKYGLPQSRKTSLMTPRQLFKHSDMPQKWQRREISNFDYLMFLNTVAGRTYNDLNQYPIFPWVLANYTSHTLDLNIASNFRDLSKPVGALSEARRKFFQERYSSWEHESIPPFHYGTHYSTQAFTLNWLLRVEPFTTMFLHFQSGKFDHSNRLFHSIAEAWESCQRDSHDVKELIPELFYMPEMLLNGNDLDLGSRDDGAVLGDVVLPPWARSPEHFIALHRQALESDLVSCQLNQWIDLIFGYKQKGPEAVRATNVFYYLTYEGALNLNSIENATVREGLEQQMISFGQTPAQLMTEPHPPRHSVMTISPTMFQSCQDDLCMLMKFISNSAIVHLSANTFAQLPHPTVISIANNLVFALNKWNNNYTGAAATPLTPSVNSPSDSGGSESLSSAPNNLPLTVDPLLAAGNPSQPLARRHLGDALDQRLKIRWNNFVTTVESRSVIVCGYPDYSFRVIDTDSARVRQVIYGHGDVVTCLARSEANLFADCYVASGSLDCTVVLWHWNAQTQTIAGEYNIPGEVAAPRAILTGHDAHITMICVSAEHGLVLSASQDGIVLIHTTQGDLLRRIEPALAPHLVEYGVSLLLMSRECVTVVLYGHEHFLTFTTTGRQLNYLRSPERILCGILSRDGEYIVVGSEEGRVSVLRLFPLQLLYSFQQTDSAVRSVALSSNQRFILAGLDSGAIVVFNIDFNKWHYEYRHRYTLR
uniref:Putative neurobeachin homolog n=1 Tax=Ascaris suum TaxID=6253 RepID=F1KPT4_ASCSU